MEISAPRRGRREENVLFVASGQIGKRPHMLAAGRNRHRLRTLPAVGSDMEMDADDGSGQGRVRVLRPSGRGDRRVDGDERRNKDKPRFLLADSP
jgi:hypothetical protein